MEKLFALPARLIPARILFKVSGLFSGKFEKAIDIFGLADLPEAFDIKNHPK